MNPYTVINVIANIIMSVSSTLLLIAIFGNEDHPVWNNVWKAWLCKLGMTATCCASLLNILTLSTPNNSEILLNCGLSLTFCWLSILQWEDMKKRKEEKKKTLIKRKKVVRRKATK